MKITIILLFVLILINLVNAQYIFSVDVEVTPKTLIAPPHVLIANTNIRSLGINSDERIDILLSYEIKDENDNIIDIRSSTLALQTSLSQSEIFNLPSNLKSGKYYVKVKVDYQGYKAFKTEEFYIEEKGFIGKINYLIDKNPVIFIVMFLVLILLFIWWMIHHIHLHHEE